MMDVLIFQKKTYIDEETHFLLKRSIIQEGDILFTIAGTVGRSCIVTQSILPSNTNQAVAIIRPNHQKLDKYFLYYYLRDKRVLSEVKKKTVRSVQANLSLKSINELLIPELSIQNQRSAVFLPKILDERIELNKKMNATLEAMAQTLFKSWFVDFDPVKAKLAAVRCGRDPEKAAMAAIACKLVVPPGKPKPENLEEKLPSAEAIDAAIASLDALSEEQMQSLKEKAAHFPSDFQESELGLIPIGFKVCSVKELVSRIKVKQKFTQKNVLARGKVVVFEQGSNLILGYHNGNADIDSSVSNPKFIFGDHTCISHLSTSPFSVGPNVIPISAALFNPYWTYYAVKDIQKFQEYRRHWMEFIVKKVVVPQNDLCEIYSDLITNFKVLINKNSNEISSCAQIRDILLPKLLSGEISV